MIELAREKRNISEVQAKLEVLATLSTMCPGFPPDHYQLSARDLTILTFARNAHRLYYHATRFIEELEAIGIRSVAPLNNHRFATVVSDAAFFEFDATIYSAKSVIERRMYCRLKDSFTEQRIEIYTEVARTILTDLVKPILKTIRDEVVHLNRLGTSVGSIAHCERHDGGPWRIELPSNYTLNGQPAGLVQIFMFLLPRVSAFVNTAVNLLAEETYSQFGVPEKPATYRVGTVSVLLPSFDIGPEDSA